eukprot:gnl/Chilomastix_caulleri/5000.p1 GENE.gnl/Chilomastix_caulleri/5000~~gnl/Chilomastix_caulleri/5000.p1  ORF type:complete len:118 (+),score=25.44 gnl/Chilomastix_caulleri/5000:157-510(+)
MRITRNIISYSITHPITQSTSNKDKSNNDGEWTMANEEGESMRIETGDRDTRTTMLTYFAPPGTNLSKRMKKDKNAGIGIIYRHVRDAERLSTLNTKLDAVGHKAQEHEQGSNKVTK